MKKIHAAATAFIISGISLASTATISAAEPISPNPTPRYTSHFSSKLTITENGKTTTTESSSTGVSIPAEKSSKGTVTAASAILPCSSSGEAFKDSSGTMTIQHKCKGTTTAWGYKNSIAACLLVSGSMHESGMSWSRNGVAKPRQASHDVGCGYTFHGTFNPAYDDDRITYSDTFTFKTKLGGSGKLEVKGDFIFMGYN